MTICDLCSLKDRCEECTAGCSACGEINYVCAWHRSDGAVLCPSGDTPGPTPGYPVSTPRFKDTMNTICRHPHRNFAADLDMQLHEHPDLLDPPDKE